MHILLGVFASDIYLYIVCILYFATMAEKQDNQLEEAIKKVDENPGYKVLTKEEYDILMKGAIPKTSTPRVPLTPNPLIPYSVLEHLVPHPYPDCSS